MPEAEVVAAVPAAAPPPAAPAKAPQARRYEIPADLFDKPAEVVAPKSEAPAEAAKDASQKPEEQAPSTEPEGEKKPETDKDDPERKRGTRRLERRLDKAYRERAEAQAQAALLAKQVEDLKPRAVADPGAPKLEQFDDIEKYAEAKAKFDTEKTLKAHEAKAQTERQQKYLDGIAQNWEKNASEADSKYDDFDAIVGEIQPNSPFAVAIMDAENGPDVAYHLGKNLKEAERIAGLPPLKQAYEIGRLSAKLLAEPTKPKTPSKAPAPIEPLTGKTTAASTGIDDPGLDDKTWMARRNKQVHRNR